ncbi:hypothetical protein KC350_g18 [Hortaea werneckii]|nr:hypothetical protein KC350_g18 [Hortaea werneckii]
MLLQLALLLLQSRRSRTAGEDIALDELFLLCQLLRPCTSSFLLPTTSSSRRSFLLSLPSSPSYKLITPITCPQITVAGSPNKDLSIKEKKRGKKDIHHPTNLTYLPQIIHHPLPFQLSRFSLQGGRRRGIEQNMAVLEILLVRAVLQRLLQRVAAFEGIGYGCCIDRGVVGLGCRLDSSGS